MICGRRSTAFCPQQRCSVINASQQRTQLKDEISPAICKPNRMEDSDLSALQIATRVGVTPKQSAEGEVLRSVLSSSAP